MNLLLGETSICSSKVGLVLTSHRVCYIYDRWGIKEYASAMLEHIDCCTVEYESRIFYLLLAVIAFVVGFANPLINISWSFQGGEVSTVLGLVVAAVLVYKYFASRATVLVISAGREPITVETSGEHVNQLFELMEAVRIPAQHARMHPEPSAAAGERMSAIGQ